VAKVQHKQSQILIKEHIVETKYEMNELQSENDHKKMTLHQQKKSHSVKYLTALHQDRSTKRERYKIKMLVTFLYNVICYVLWFLSSQYINFLYTHITFKNTKKQEEDKKKRFFFLNKIIILMGENVLKIFDSMPTNKREEKKTFFMYIFVYG